nr:hypothetical protein [Tanacetum cinerariifolium]
MADMSAPSGQAPAVAPPVRTDDEIFPYNRWVQIGKSNCSLNLDKKQSNPIFKMAVDLLMHTNFHGSFTASTIDTIQYDKKAGNYRCQLDEQWFVLTKDTLREALQITPINNTQDFVAPPSAEVLVDLVNQLGYPRMVRNVSNIVTNDMFQSWRALTTIINLCLMGKTSGFERPRVPVLQILWGIITQSNIDYAERIWEEFTQSIHTFMKDKRNLRHKLHLRPDSALYLANDEPVLGYLKFSAKPVPTSAPAKSKENKLNQATETTVKPVKAKRIKHSISRKTRQPRRSPKSVGASEAEEVPAEEPWVADEEANYQKAVEESLKTAHAVHRGPLPPVVIREPESGKYQPPLEVPGKGKAKVTEEQITHDLLSLQKAKRKNPMEQYIFQRHIFEPTGSSFHDESPYDVLGQSDSEEESKKVLTGAFEGGNDDVQTGPDPDVQDEGQKETDADTLDEGHAGSNPDERSECQAGPDLGITGNEKQSIPNPVVHAGSDRKHMDLDVTKASPQPSTEQLDEGFLTTAYPKIQESLKLAVEEQVLLEEPASSSGTLSSLHHLSRDISFGDQFFSDKPLDVDKNAKTKVESMVSIAVSEVVTDAVDWAMQASLRNRFRDLPEAGMIEILHQRMWETESYKTHEDHSLLFEALENLMNRDHSEELAQDLAEAHKKKRKRRESPKTPPGSPPHQPSPPPPPTRPSGLSEAPGASGSQATPPPPPLSTSQDSPSKGSALPSPSKTAASTEHQAWTMPDVTLRPFISLTPADLDMDEAMEERIATPEPAWSIPSSNAPVTLNNWASALASDYSPPPKDSLLEQTSDMATFIDWFCKRRGITKLKPQDLEGPAFEIIKVFHPDVIHLQYQMEECHKLLTDSVDDSIPRNNVSKPLTMGGPPGQITIQSDFFFNKDLEYLRYRSKGNRPALSISKMKAAYYLDVGLEQMVPDQFWINREYKYDIAAIDGTLRQIDEALDYRVKEFRINRMNPGLNTRFWTRKDVDRCKAFIFVIQRRLRLRRIFRNLESFVGGRLREGDYRLLKRTE